MRKEDVLADTPEVVHEIRRALVKAMEDYAFDLVEPPSVHEAALAAIQFAAACIFALDGKSAAAEAQWGIENFCLALKALYQEAGKCNFTFEMLGVDGGSVLRPKPAKWDA